MSVKIYLDNNATTQLDPKVVSTLIEDLSAPPSNPSSIHFFGREAKQKLLQARNEIASYFKAKPTEILFTSCGTESMNFLIRGSIDPLKKSHIITSNVEHSCVENTVLDLQSKGCQISFLPAGLKGFVSADQVKEALRENTKLLVLSAANGETGVLTDLEPIADLAHRLHIPLIIDAVALLGKAPILMHPGITGMGFSAHKIHGPKGVGFVFLRSKSFPITPLLTGGGQEYGFRSGTENITGILGLAKAIKILQEEQEGASKHMLALRNHFEQTLLSKTSFTQINGTGLRVCNVSNLAFLGVDAETLLIQLDRHGIAASQGSACSSGALEPSRILLQMGLSPSIAKSSVRFSFCKYNTLKEIDYVIEILLALLPKLKSS
jgi:cysteine desulfurase